MIFRFDQKTADKLGDLYERIEETRVPKDAPAEELQIENTAYLIDISKLREIRRQAEQAHMQTLHNPAAVMQDALAVTDDAIISAWLTYLQVVKHKMVENLGEPPYICKVTDIVFSVIADGPARTWPSSIDSQKASQKNPYSVFLDQKSATDVILQTVLADHFRMLREWDAPGEGPDVLREKLTALIAASPYTSDKGAPESAKILSGYMPIYTEPGGRMLQYFNSAKVSIKNRTGIIITETDKAQFEMTIDKYNSVAPEKWGEGVAKLYDAACLAFTEQYGREYLPILKNNPNYRGPETVISVSEFARLCGYEIDVDEDTPESEKKKIQRRKKYTRAKINDDLLALSVIRLTRVYKDGRKRQKDYHNIGIIEASSKIVGDHITFRFTRDYAIALLQSPQTSVPKWLFLLTGRPYMVARKMIEYGTMDANVLKNKQHRIGVQTLLTAGQYPDARVLTDAGDMRHWQRRVKEALEDDLQEIESTGGLSEVYYCGENDRKLTDKELEKSFTDYYAFTKLNMHFVLVGAEDRKKQAKKNQRRRIVSAKSRSKKKQAAGSAPASEKK